MCTLLQCTKGISWRSNKVHWRVFSIYEGARTKRLYLKEFECYVDASHAGDWKQMTAIDDPDTARSRTGCVLSYAKCPLIWASKLQTEIALSHRSPWVIASITLVGVSVVARSVCRTWRAFCEDICHQGPSRYTLRGAHTHRPPLYAYGVHMV